MPPWRPGPVLDRRENHRILALESRQDVFFQEMCDAHLAEEYPQGDHIDVIEFSELFEPQAVVQLIIDCCARDGFVRVLGHATTPSMNQSRPREDAAPSVIEAYNGVNG